MPLPERALTSLFVGYGGRAILIDCGEGTQTVLKKQKVKYSRIDTILLTHLHGDHICGLAGLLLTFGLMERTEPLKIYGPAGTKNMIFAVLTIATGLPFPISCEELSGECEFSEIGLKINAFPVQHSVPCIGYRLSLERAPEFDATKAKALGIPVSLWSRLQRGEAVDGFSQADVSGPARRGISLVYATDTRPLDIISDYGKDADLMILEGMYGEEDRADKAEEVSHMTMCEAAGVAKSANAKSLWLTHYSPSVTDPTEFYSDVKAIFANTVFGYDGLSCKLKFD